MRTMPLLTAAVALTAAPVLAFASSAPTSASSALAFQRIAALASAESASTVSVWIEKETKNGLLPPCGEVIDPARGTPSGRHQRLYAVAATARGQANDAWLLAELVKAQGGNNGIYVVKANKLSRTAAENVVLLRRCGKV